MMRRWLCPHTFNVYFCRFHSSPWCAPVSKFVCMSLHFISHQFSFRFCCNSIFQMFLCAILCNTHKYLYKQVNKHNRIQTQSLHTHTYTYIYKIGYFYSVLVPLCEQNDWMRAWMNYIAAHIWLCFTSEIGEEIHTRDFLT